MRKIAKILLFSALMIFTIRYIFLSPPDLKTKHKLNLIKTEISKKGYHNRWFVISGIRYNWYNRILPNSVNKSYHIKGKAIDIFVFDINGDLKFTNEDIQLLQFANKSVEDAHPELVGAFGTYTNKSCLARHMIHLDTRGYSVRYNL